MGNDDHRRVLAQTFNGLLYGLLCSTVKGGGGFVKDDELWLAVKCSGNGYTL